MLSDQTVRWIINCGQTTHITFTLNYTVQALHSAGTVYRFTEIKRHKIYINRLTGIPMEVEIVAIQMKHMVKCTEYTEYTRLNDTLGCSLSNFSTRHKRNKKIYILVRALEARG